ncbi:hypothetical protein ANRL3_00395 [Anaerolineae bacterium]|nr:hypothetical protein ANRL3_00395 [Anaerolineae bacterium]
MNADKFREASASKIPLFFGQCSTATDKPLNFTAGAEDAEKNNKLRALCVSAVN